MANKKSKGKTQANKTTQANRIWPVLFIVGGILLVAVAIIVLRQDDQPETSIQPQVTGAPAISIDPQEIDMGQVKLGTTVKADFLVQNIGDQPLKFTENPYVELVEGC